MMEEMEARKEVIRKFFAEKRKKEVPADDTDLFENGFVDSLFAIEIVVFLEKEFKIKIKNKEITKDNFRNINNIANVVANAKRK
ncbi:MAG: acyl carrier protein [Firmicutes bacterium]|nr:acyl carrier protein [Bacillota bacterium]